MKEGTVPVMDEITQVIEQLLDDEHRADQLANLDDEALSSLHDQLRAHARAVRDGEIDGVDPDDVDALSAIRDAVQVIAAEQTHRAEAAAELERLQAERAAQAAQLAEELLTEPEPTPEPEVADPAAAAEPEPEPEPAPAAMPAPRPTLAQLAANRPAHAEPTPTPVVHTSPRWQLKNGGVADLEDLAAIGERILEARTALLSAPPGFADKVTVASIKVDRPSEMDVRAGDDLGDTMRKVEAVTAAGRNPAAWTDEQRAIVASGGWAAPAEPRYQIPNIASAARPVRDGLPSLGVSRGSITYVKAARLSSIVTGGPSTSGAAITTWENSTDTTPGGSTKQRQTFAPRSATTVNLGAVVARGRFGNLQTRGFPEDVAHDIQLMASAHARIAEKRLLDNLITAIGIDVTQTGFFGTARDVRQVLAQSRSEMQATERTKQAVRALINDVILDMCQQDVFFQSASGEIANLLVSEAEVRAIIAASGVNVTYTMDTPSGGDYFRTNATGENLADYPDDFEIPIFFDGSVLFLDGGELNVGIVRDSTLNNTNDYEMFYETFEDVAWLGPYGKTLTLTTCPNGISQASATVSTVCSGS